MAMPPNGPTSRNPPSRRLRFDTNADGPLEPGHSGRRLVAVAVLTILIVWGGLYLAFRNWRARVLARAAYGARVVAPTVDPLARLVPKGVPDDEWRSAVRQTHELLEALTAANLLDRAQMEQLHTELAARVAAARPESSRHVLKSVWDDMNARAGPVLVRRRRPRVLE